MVDLEYWKEKALACGFSHVGELDVDTIELRKEARDACAENKCHNYGKNWSCPPGCGTLEECDAKIRKFKRGLLVQTTGEIDSLDFDGFMELGKNHGEAMKKFAELVRRELPGAVLLCLEEEHRVEGVRIGQLLHQGRAAVGADGEALAVFAFAFRTEHDAASFFSE